MNRLSKIGVSIVATLCFLSLPAAVVIYGLSVSERRAALADTAHTLCVHDQRTWDATSKLIENIGKPSVTGNGLDRALQNLPPDTPTFVKPLLEQINAPLTPEQIDQEQAPFHASQGPRPVC